jgi:hypothetical protein
LRREGPADYEILARARSLEKALRKPSPGRAASCYDLAATLKGLPKDLAEYPKYMECLRIS